MESSSFQLHWFTRTFGHRLTSAVPMAFFTFFTHLFLAMSKRSASRCLRPPQTAYLNGPTMRMFFLGAKIRVSLLTSYLASQPPKKRMAISVLGPSPPPREWRVFPLELPAKKKTKETPWAYSPLEVQNPTKLQNQELLPVSASPRGFPGSDRIEGAAAPAG